MQETESPPVESAEQRAEREGSEADALRRFPGVEFSWSNGERRATLCGSGIEVWEAIRALEKLKWDMARMLAMWPHVPRDVVLDAIRYYRACPTAIDTRIAASDAFERAHFAALAEERAGEGG